MKNLLPDLAVRRVAAVDGKMLTGPEANDLSRPPSPETLSRYNRGCVLSHRQAMQEFLAGGESHGCVLEDDVFISPDFFHLVKKTDWIPKGCHLVKLETTRQEVTIARRGIACGDRHLFRLRSLHFGTAAYIISRRGAERLLEMTQRPDRSIDRILFEPAGLKNMGPVYQLVPAPCIQAGHHPGGIIFPELKSSIQPQPSKPATPNSPMPSGPVRQPSFNKLSRELRRPFCQLNGRARFLTGELLDRLRGVRRVRVPFA